MQGITHAALSHEFTHFVEELSAEKFRKFTDILFDVLGKNDVDVNRLIEAKEAVLRNTEEYKGRSDKDLRAIAYSEVVAEMMEPVLTDTDAISRISQKIKQQDKSLWGKIKDFIKGIVEKLKAAYRGMEPDSAIARLTRETVTNSEAVLDAFSEAAADAVLSYNLQDGQKNNAPEGGLYSLREQTQQEITERYQQEVDQVLNAPYADSRQLLVGYTPSVYQELGMPSLPLTIGSGHVYSTAKTEAQARQDGNYKRGVHYHGLGDAAVKNIYNAIQDPVMIIAAKDVSKNASPMRSTHSVVAIVDIGTAGKSLLVPIEITAERKVNGTRMDVNTISSVYERNVSNLVREAIALENSGDVGVYYAKKEALTLPAAGVRFPARLQQSIASNSIIHRFSEKVNMKISENTQSQQFKRWFGDWQNDPANASKVVNADGTPKVVYHGTNAEFTVFDLSKSGRNYGETSEGLFFFTNKRSGYQDSALDYAKAAARNGGEATVGEYYLDIKNPLRLYSDGYFTPTAYFDQNAQDIYEKYLSGDYDGIIIENRNKSADDSIIYMLDNPNQIKSATDNVGTFDGSNPDILYSSRTASDSEYLNLAQNPEKNREALSRMVEQAAREAGYDSPMLYHGTQSFGFTNFDLDKMDDKRSIFLTSNPDIAATYSGVDGSRNIGKASGTDISTLSLQEVAQMMNQFPPESGMDYQYSVVGSKAEISGQVDRGLNELNNLINTLKKQYGKDSKEYGRLEKLQNTLYLGTNDGLSTQLWMILKQTDLFKGYEDFVNGLEQNLRLLKKAPESGSFLVEKALGGYSIDVLSEADAKEELAQNMQRGNYALYARLGNTLTVEGEGQRWNNLKNWARGMEVDENSTYVMEDDGKFFLLRKTDDSVVENGVIDATEKARELSPDALQFLLIQKANTSLRILTEVATTTRDVTKWAKNAGYDSVIFKNIKDSGGQNNSVSMDTTADIYAIFNPNNAKSADAVTYDDNGNVIPLSQRFDMGKEDIRYSARYAAAEENPEIADLVQRVLSGDFKANDKVYLGTVPSQNAARIQEITGIDVDGFRVAIEARQIEHILNRHGIEGSADHSMAQVSDISKIQYTLDNPDSITPAGKTSAYVYMRNGKNRTADTVLYEKDIGGKSYYTVQAIADTKAKTLYVVSAFIGESGYKKGTPQFTNAKSLGATSETAAVDVPTGNVAQSGTNVKGENLESRRVSQEIKDAIEEYRRQQDVQSKAYRQMYERQMEEVKKSYQKQISTMESEYSADLAQIQDAFFQTVEAYEKGQFRNEHLEKALKQAMEAQRTQTKASEADNATWEKEFKRLLKAYETSGRNVQRLKQTVEAQRARAKAKVEAARVTEQRGKLYRAVNEINRRLLNPTKTLYVPDSLAPAVTKFMQGLTEAMESPKNSWNVQGALETLQGQYRKLTQMNEGVFTQEYNQGILDLLDNAISAVGGTDFNKLSASQIEDVYSAVRSVLTAIRNENKMFAANLNKTYAEAAAAVLREESALPNRKPTTGTVQDKAEKFGWNQLKPVYAMMRLGSDTLLKQYNNLRAGEDKWQRVIAAARAYGLGTMAKYNYDQWDDSLMKLDTETGTVELSLQERMSLYAYARREQAFEHLTKGGFVLSDKNTRTVKNRLGIETEQT